MSQPNPTPNDMPLVQGVDASWNNVLSHIPEDKRSEVVPFLQERDKTYKELEPWGELNKQGVDFDTAQMALDVFGTIENNPQMVYDTLGKHLGITPQQAKEAVETAKKEETTEEEAQPEYDITQHPAFQKAKQQLDAMAQIMLAQKNEQETSTKQKEQDEALEKDLKALEEKYGEYPEKEIVMRIIHLGVDAETAYKDWLETIDQYKKMPAPYVLGGGGPVPRQNIDVKKLDDEGAKSLVVQMLENSQRGEQ